MLYLCPTPIGNLSDISRRTLETLQNVDAIACEDTRTSGQLLAHYGISKPLVSYHKFNEQQRASQLLERLKAGENIALVSDAGMPGISDPGQILVRRCHEQGIAVTALPGPCAFITALAMSGLDSRRFTFEGFLPPDKKEQEEVLEELRNGRTTMIFYEAPHRLRQTLKLLCPFAGERPAALVREISKKFEEVRTGTLNALAAEVETREPRGEYVILVEGLSRSEQQERQSQSFEDLSLAQHMKLYEDLPLKEAMRQVAKDRGISRREVYDGLLQEKEKGGEEEKG